jgi:hypothetical protein
MHIELAELVSSTDIHDDTDRAPVVGKTFAQYASRIRFKNRCVERPIDQ